MLRVNSGVETHEEENERDKAEIEKQVTRKTVVTGCVTRTKLSS